MLLLKKRKDFLNKHDFVPKYFETAIFLEMDYQVATVGSLKTLHNNSKVKPFVSQV